VDVILNLLGDLGLDDQVNLGDVEASGGNVGGDNDTELSITEGLEGQLPLLLGDIAVQGLGLELQGVG
jgi:hypothetical protein